MKRFQLTFILALFTLLAWSQSTIDGMVKDRDSEPLIGASVVIQGTTIGAITDFDGSFKITDVPSGQQTLLITYVGYEDKVHVINVTGDVDLGVLELNTSALGLEEVVVTGTMDIVKDRRTPVAVSTISAAEIQLKASGNVELVEIAKSTPSVYIAGQSGGYGDSEVYTRGFDQTNTAFLLNGQPINGMEDGKMYWSNWSGISDVASAVQVQRGLGSSKLAISSVGGTWNFVMKATDNSKSASIATTIGNDNYQKVTGIYNTGLINGKWGVSALFSQWSGDGWANGTQGQGQTYYLSVGYIPKDGHKLNFLITGAPQWHHQNFDKSISSYFNNEGDLDRRYNNNWGIYDGDIFSERRNYYHKPVMNLNWDWKINSRSTLATVLYASFGRGGGTGQLTGQRIRTQDGLINFNESADSSYVLRASVNNHNWVGSVVNFEHKLTEKLSFNVGGDYRRYFGDHFRQVAELFTNESYFQRGVDRYPNGYTVTNEYKADPWAALSDFAPEGERVAYNNAETIKYFGLFGQVEYNIEKFSAYVQGAWSTQNYQRHEKFGEPSELEDAPEVDHDGYTLKTGVSYSPNNFHTFFANVGEISRQPFFDVLYLGFTNNVNELAENEKISSFEIGYKFVNSKLSANVNYYNTAWRNHIEYDSYNQGDVVRINGIDYSLNGDGSSNTKQDQLHTGFEIDAAYYATDKLSIKGFGSFGNWEIDGDAHIDLFEVEDNGDRRTIASEDLGGDNSIDGQKIGGAAQTFWGLGLRYEIIGGLTTDVDFRNYSNLWSTASQNNIELPDYALVDWNVNYSLPLENGNVVRFGLNVYNVFDEEYISRSSGSTAASSNPSENWNGINVSNRVNFGTGRTWNFTVKYVF